MPEHTLEIWGGMECTINKVGDKYFDQLELSGHYHRSSDMNIFAGLGLKKMRYPILWEHHQPDKNRPIDWTKTESKIQNLRGSNISVIAGLVHHGSGPAYVDILNNNFARGLADFAALVAKKFPWIEYYTPVNEPLTTARFCGLYGHWYPHKKDDDTFCRILVNECKATVLAMAAIRVINPNAKLVQTDDLSKVHSSTLLSYQADFENERRWLSFDLLCGKVDEQHGLWAYLTGHGITIEELDFFTANPCPPDIIGANYYLTSERYLDECKEKYPAHTHGGHGLHTYADVEAVRVGKICPDGIELLLETLWKRYKIPIAITEVHLNCTREEQMRWLNEAWFAAKRLCNSGVPVIAVTPWALLGSFGWNQLLTRPRGTYEPGVFDISCGYPRSTILADMIVAFSRNEKFSHYTLDYPGWWKRRSRVIYGKEESYSAFTLSGALIVVSGTFSLELCEIGHIRCLPIVTLSTLHIITGYVAVTIVVGEHMEISRDGYPDLIVYLETKNLYQSLNAALDLMLDGEFGYWEMLENGSLIGRNHHNSFQYFDS